MQLKKLELNINFLMNMMEEKLLKILMMKIILIKLLKKYFDKIYLEIIDFFAFNLLFLYYLFYINNSN